MLGLVVSVSLGVLHARPATGAERAGIDDDPDGRAYWRAPARARTVADGRPERVPTREPVPSPDAPMPRRVPVPPPRVPSAPAPTPPPVPPAPPVPEKALALSRRDIDARLRRPRDPDLGIESDGPPCFVPGKPAGASPSGSPAIAFTGARDDDLARLFEELERETNDGSLDAGVSRRWSTLRLVCEPGPAPETTPDERGEESFPDAPAELPTFFDEPDTAGDAPAVFLVDDDVPPGFEALAGPQLFWADVWFNGRNRGATALTTTAETIVFDAPADVVAMLDGATDPEALLVLLSEPLPTNAHLACFREDDPLGCGRVEADPVAVIWDEGQLRLDLFLAARLQTLQAREAAKNLVAPERRGSSILSLHASGSDTAAADPALDLSARLLAGYGSGYVSTAADYGSRQEEARLRELKLTHQADGHEFAAGTYAWNPGGAWVDIDLLGVGFSTSFNTRVDLDRAFGSELVVHLQRRAIVQLLVDGRVLFGSTYAAGNQAIDTRALPDGTYPVEIRITESDGTTRSEFRTFTRSTSIPPRGEPVFGLSVGLARGDTLFPGTEEPLVAGFSLANRVGDRAAWTLGMLQLDDLSFAQGEFVYLGERATLQAAATVGQESTSALGLYTAYTSEAGVFSATLERVDSAIRREDDPRLERLYPTNGTRWSVGASRSLGDYALRAGASRRLGSVGVSAAREETRYTLGVGRPLFRGRDLQGAIGAELNRVGDEVTYTLRADLRFGRDGWHGRVGTDAARHGRDDTDAGVSADVDYAANDAGPFDWRAGLYGRVDDDRTLGVRAAVEHPLYRAGASSETTWLDGGGTSTSSIASASAHIGLDRGGLAIGGAESARAGVIVSVRGEPAGAPFDIVVDGRRVAGGRIGTARFVGLQPFETHHVSLVAEGVLSNGIGSDVHEFTLYPGNVQRIDVVAETRVLLIAALIEPDGTALGSAVVEIDDNPQVTDADGILQAEVVPGSRLSVRTLDGRRCTTVVPEAPPGTEFLVPDEPLVCTVDEPGSEGMASAQ